MGFKEGFSRFLASVAVTGAMGGADAKAQGQEPPGSAEVQPTNRGGLSFNPDPEAVERRNAAAQMEQQETIRVTTEEIRDTRFNGLSIIENQESPGEYFFTRDNGSTKVILLDGFGHEIHPTVNDAVFFIVVDGQRLDGNTIVDSDRGFVFQPEGYTVVETPQGTQLHRDDHSYDQTFQF